MQGGVARTVTDDLKQRSFAELEKLGPFRR